MNDQNSTNGIPDAHAFAVGQATGVNINGSALGAAGAALHSSSSSHHNSSSKRTNNESNGGGNFTNMNQSSSNKNIAKLFLVFIPIIMIGFITLFMLNKNQFFQSIVRDKETIVSDKDYLYEKGVNYLKNKYHDLNTRKEQKDYNVLISYQKFGITKDKDYYYAYMWVLSESYFVKNDELFQGRSNSSLYKISFSNDEVVGYDMPGNGKSSENSEYSVMSKEYDFADSLKTLCLNKEVYNNIMNNDISLSNEGQIREKYSYLNDFTIHHENLGRNDRSNQNEVVPYPNDKAQGGSGYIPR